MQSIKEAGSYKYVLDVDGNGWSGRFKRLITSNSLVFKATIYPEWYSDRIQPWLHYVPVQVDLSDLHDSLLFFRGDPSGAGAHEDMARTIAAAGREWSKTYWRREDLIAYFFRLILEYVRLLSLDRDAMSLRSEEKPWAPLSLLNRNIDSE
ncbi:Protein O-Glucosyltransferase/Glycosyltransferase 90 [Pleurotus pulmonarius]